MQLRRTLPLTLAALALTAGCMTVRPAGPPGPAPAAARSSVARPAAAPLTEPVALPLGRLPSPSGAGEQAPDAPEVRGAAAAPEVPVAAAAPEVPVAAAAPEVPVAAAAPERAGRRQPKRRRYSAGGWPRVFTKARRMASGVP
ncbi:hypothetical protein HET69_33060 [Streptomyces sp. CJ_13]|uniref:hypothetical protein n=1 Tax=Streptomyces sp. CJ_13 TaxID=2724943 RepID=UPI001BDBD845|nr:hypothetical protein [Streptomyces sp. CJ_13]MBT1188684.1 hypothetical protein [Streptomyces sp. CJ_13]